MRLSLFLPELWLNYVTEVQARLLQALEVALFFEAPCKEVA